MTHGMVCAPQPEAVEAGALALRNGGNAVDAAIVCALVQTAVDPQMCGIAGFGSLHLYLPGQGVHRCLDFHGRAPAKARPEMWADLIESEAEDGFGFKLSGQVNDLGYQAVTTPGSLKAYHEVLSRYGTLDWKGALAPAIEAALSRRGGALNVVVFLCGTKGDHQGLEAQAARLLEAGAVVTRSNAHAAQLALEGAGLTEESS